LAAWLHAVSSSSGSSRMAQAMRFPAIGTLPE
jgi:hypothetical protein